MEYRQDPAAEDGDTTGEEGQANLFPEAAKPKPGSHEKDRLENKLHQLVCAGDLGLRSAQRAIASNWVRAYKKYVGALAG